MIEVRIWTHLSHPSVKVGVDTLARMQADAEVRATGRYCVIWCTGEERTLVINWSNVIMLECPSPQSLLDAVQANDHDHTGSVAGASGFDYDFSGK